MGRILYCVVVSWRDTHQINGRRGVLTGLGPVMDVLFMKPTGSRTERGTSGSRDDTARIEGSGKDG